MKNYGSGGSPLYLEVKKKVVQRIIDEIWRPGDLLPSEGKLADEFDVSQGTVRKALNELTDEKLLYRRQGKGTFVASHTPQRSLFHFFHIATPDGERSPAVSRLLGVSRRRATREETLALALPPQSRVVQIDRLRELGGRSCILERIRLPGPVFSSLGSTSTESLPNELYVYYEETYGVTIYRATETLRAVAATQEQAKQLNVPAGTPLLEIARTAFTLDNKPIELRTSWCDSRYCHYVSELA